MLTAVLFLGSLSLARDETERPSRRRTDRKERYEPRRPRLEDAEFKEFREQIGRLGRRIRQNSLLIGELEAELAAASDGERGAIQSRLDEALRERAILKYTLTRHRVRLTQRVLELSRIRHEEALAKLEEVEAETRRDWPDLDLENLPEIIPVGD